MKNPLPGPASPAALYAAQGPKPQPLPLPKAGKPRSDSPSAPLPTQDSVAVFVGGDSCLFLENPGKMGHIQKAHFFRNITDAQ